MYYDTARTPPRHTVHQPLALPLTFALVLLGLGPQWQSRPLPLPGIVPAVSAPSGYSALPLAFERNAGQAAEEVRFVARGPGYTLLLSPAQATLRLTQHQATTGAGAAGPRAGAELTMRLVGADPHVRVTGGGRLPGVAHYLHGSDPAGWRTGVPTYARVSYAGAYPGVDVVFYGNQRELEYDFVVAPGASPSVIALQFAGGRAPRIAANGDLVLAVGDSEIRQLRPVIYQDVDGTRRTVQGRYVVAPSGQVGFEVGAYDRTRPLVIDPVIRYSTYVGGASGELGLGIAVDAEGHAYVTGSTSSVNFPVRNARQPRFAGFDDVFVMKLDPTGSRLIYSTYLGGGDSDMGHSIAIGPDGRAYVTGITSSSDFPVSARGWDRTPGGGDCGDGLPCPDAFVAKLYIGGNGLIYSSYLGRTAPDSGEDIAVDQNGYAYVSGLTEGSFPTTASAYDRTFNDAVDAQFPGDAFLTKVNPTGSGLVYSTYLGGGAYDIGSGVAVDRSGHAYVGGNTASRTFPTTPGARDRSFNGGFGPAGDVFVTEVNTTGSRLNYSTFIGGSGNDYGNGIAVDTAGQVYITGQTESANFPTTAGARDRTCGSDGRCNAVAGQPVPPPDAYVSVVNAIGSALVYSTYVGGGGTEVAYDVAVDRYRNAYITGFTESRDFPNTKAGTGLRGDSDAFVTKVSSTGRSFLYSHFLGGSAPDERGRQGESGNGIAVGADGAAYITGGVVSRDFPTTAGAIDRTHNGGSTDVFVTKLR